MIAGTSKDKGEMSKKGEKEVIHSGHFMVSNFEAEAQDDEENVLLDVPDEGEKDDVRRDCKTSAYKRDHSGGLKQVTKVLNKHHHGVNEMFNIDSSLTKLFNAMSIAYK